MAQLLEYIKMAFFNILSNKMRSALTMLGIVIGIASVILIMSLGNGAKNMISGELNGSFNGQVGVQTLIDEYMTEADMEAIVDQVDGIITYKQDATGMGEVSTIKGDFDIYVTGCLYDNYLFTPNVIVENGRYFSEQEADNAADVCYMMEDEAIRMFGTTDVLGMTVPVTFGSRGMGEYRIIGILQYEKEDTMVSFNYSSMPVTIYVPIRTLQKDLGINGDDIMIDVVYLLMDEKADAKTTCDEVLNVLNSRHGTYGSDSFYIQTFADYMSTLNTVINLITLFISLVAAISLIVGGIGVMNIMLVSVTERTREIGIRKALGAKTGSITMQFLAESAIITMLGGIIGIICGIGGAYLITTIITMIDKDYAFTPSIGILAVIGTTLFSSAVGLFFGIYPARKAAKMNPIDALRSL